MVLEISIEANKEPHDINWSYGAYTVYADDHRILTIVTSCNDTVSKWLNDVLKATKNKLSTDLVVVGVSVERESLEYAKGGVRDSPYELLNLCVGSHCVIFHLEGLNQHTTPRVLRTFFDHPRVVAVGIDMKPVAQKLERDLGIKIKNPMDLRSLAIEGLKREELNVWRYDLDKLTKTVFGKHMDVVRPEKLDWFDRSNYYWWYFRVLSLDKVQFSTIDAYLCFLVGSKLLNMIHGSVGGSCSSKKMKKSKK